MQLIYFLLSHYHYYRLLPLITATLGSLLNQPLFSISPEFLHSIIREELLFWRSMKRIMTLPRLPGLWHPTMLKWLSLSLTSFLDSTKLEVTLKLNKMDIEAVLQTFKPVQLFCQSFFFWTLKLWKSKGTLWFFDELPQCLIGSGTVFFKNWTIFGGRFKKINSCKMNVALFGKSITPSDIPYIQDLLDKLDTLQGQIFIHSQFYNNIREMVTFGKEPVLFSSQGTINGKADFLFSIGGDGTLLDTITIVGDSGIPIIGINTGRMGFLSSIAKAEILRLSMKLLKTSSPLTNGLCSGWKPPTIFSEIWIMHWMMLPFTRPPQFPCSPSRPLSTMNTWILTGQTDWSWQHPPVPQLTHWVARDRSSRLIQPILSSRPSQAITSRSGRSLSLTIVKISLIVESRDSECFVGLDSRIEKIDSTIRLDISKENFKINLFTTLKHFILSNDPWKTEMGIRPPQLILVISNSRYLSQ